MKIGNGKATVHFESVNVHGWVVEGRTGMANSFTF